MKKPKTADGKRKGAGRPKGKQRKDKIACNLVDYEVGKTIFATAMGVILRSNVKQESLFRDGW